MAKAMRDLPGWAYEPERIRAVIAAAPDTRAAAVAAGVSLGTMRQQLSKMRGIVAGASHGLLDFNVENAVKPIVRLFPARRGYQHNRPRRELSAECQRLWLAADVKREREASSS